MRSVIRIIVVITFVLAVACSIQAGTRFISPSNHADSVPDRVLRAREHRQRISRGMQITPEIQALVRGLHGDPQKMYEFVRNNIDFELYFGLTKGALMTLMDRSGNDMDQSALLIAMLTEAGYTANYVYGTIQLTGPQATSWLGIPDNPELAFDVLRYSGIDEVYVAAAGDSIDFVRIEHCWVKVRIDSVDYVFDPSFKEYENTACLDLATAMGYDRSLFLADAEDGMSTHSDYIQNVNTSAIRSDLASLSANLKTYIQQNHPDAGLGDILGKHEIIEVIDQPLQVSLPYQYSVDWETPADEPDYTTTVCLDYYSDGKSKYPDFSVTLESRDVYGRPFILYTESDGQDRIIHVACDGQELATGLWTESGLLDVIVDHASLIDEGTYADAYWLDQQIDPETFYCFLNGWGHHTGRRIIAWRQKKLSGYVTEDPAPDPKKVLGESLNVIGLHWLCETGIATERNDEISGSLTIRHHNFGWVAQKDSVYLDTMTGDSFLSMDGNQYPTSKALFVNASLNSALEWGIIDQCQPISGVSTVKLMDMSASMGNKLFTAESDNYQEFVRPFLLGYTPDQMHVIDDLIAQGYRLILPEHGDITDGSYQGVGFYAIRNDAYFTYISGDLNGGYGTEPWDCDPDAARDAQRSDYDPQSHPNSREPIDLQTGHFIDRKLDLNVGGDALPYGLEFIRSYNSDKRYRNGPLGPGWSHNMNFFLKRESDGYRGLGYGAPVDTIAAIVAISVANDLVKNTDLPLDRVVIANSIIRWLMDQLIDNTVGISTPAGEIQFQKLPDDSWQPPRGKWATLENQPNDTYVYTMKHGTALLFDTEGKLIQWSDPNGNTVDFTYSDTNLTDVTNNMGKSLHISYNYDGRITSVTDNTGRSVTYSYDSDANLVAVTDQMNHTLTYQYSQPGVLTRVYLWSDQENPFVVNTYDEFDRVIHQVDYSGNTYDYYYADGLLTEEVDPEGYSRFWWFDQNGNLKQLRDALGYDTFVDYDGLGRLLRTTLPEGNGWEYVRDSHDNVTQITLFPKTGSTLDPITRYFTYEPSHWNISGITDSGGHTYNINYDANGNADSILFPDTGSGRAEIDYTVNSRGQITHITGPENYEKSFETDPVTGERTRMAIDPSGLALQYSWEYDAVGNIVSATYPAGETQTFQYDANRHLTRVIAPAPFYYETQMIVDADGNLIETRRETGKRRDDWQIYAWNYNLGGDAKEFRGPSAHSIDYFFNSNQKLWKVTSALGNTYENTYDPTGRALMKTDPLGNVIEQHTYTPNGQLLAVTDANGNDISFTYDDFDRLTRETYADGTYIEYNYNAAGLLSGLKSRAGEQITFTYDALDRMTSKTLPGSETIHYSYDGLNRCTRVSDTSGNIDFEYDGAGRVISVTYADGKTVEYGYDGNDNITMLTYPDGYRVTYTYDSLGRLTHIYEDGSTLLARYSYDSLSRITSVLYANGASMDYTYNPDDSILSTTYHFSGEDVALQYEYDAEGKCVQRSWDNADFAYPFPGESLDVFTANNLNQYSQINGTNYQYDLNGNLISDGRQTYTYDAENRLLSVTNPDTTVQYHYNALGYRDAQEKNGVRTVFYYGINHVLEEFSDSGTLINRYVYGPGIDALVMMDSGAGRYFYHSDRNHSIIALSDNTGARAETYSYSPFGLPGQAGAVGNPYLYNAREYDADTGLYFHRARDFSPYLGRYLQPDPPGVQNGSGLNLYCFTENDPVNYLDPFGLAPAENSGIVARAGRIAKGAYNGLSWLTHEGALALKAASKRVWNHNFLQSGISSAQWGYWWKGGKNSKAMREELETFAALLREHATEERNKNYKICNATAPDFSKFLKDKGWNPKYFDYYEIGVGLDANDNPGHLAFALTEKGSLDPVVIVDPIATGGFGLGIIPSCQWTYWRNYRVSTYLCSYSPEQWLAKNEWVYGNGYKIMNEHTTLKVVKP